MSSNNDEDNDHSFNFDVLPSHIDYVFNIVRDVGAKMKVFIFKPTRVRYPLHHGFS